MNVETCPAVAMARRFQLALAGEAMLSALREAETALQQGLDDCGNDPACLWADPLATVQMAIAQAEGRA